MEKSVERQVGDSSNRVSVRLEGRSDRTPRRGLVHFVLTRDRPSPTYPGGLEPRGRRRAVRVLKVGEDAPTAELSSIRRSAHSRQYLAHFLRKSGRSEGLLNILRVRLGQTVECEGIVSVARHIYDLDAGHQ